MLFTKTLLVFLVAILGTSWVPEGRINGLVSAGLLFPRSLDRYEKPIVPTTYGVPMEDEEFTPLTISIWAGVMHYKLPNAPSYILVFKNGIENFSTCIPNPFYRESMYRKETSITIDDIRPKYEEFTPLNIGIWVGKTYYILPNAPTYSLVIKEGASNVTGYIENPFY